MNRLQRKLDTLRRLGEARGALLYAVLVRNAGWGIQWWEAARCELSAPEALLDVPVVRGGPPSSMADLMAGMRARLDVARQRVEEGLVLYAYYPSLTEAVDKEMRRVLDLVPYRFPKKETAVTDKRVIEGGVNASAGAAKATNKRGPLVEDTSVVGGVDTETGAPVIRPKTPEGSADLRTEATDPREGSH